jgi:hypothetical protein
VDRRSIAAEAAIGQGRLRRPAVMKPNRRKPVIICTSSAHAGRLRIGSHVGPHGSRDGELTHAAVEFVDLELTEPPVEASVPTADEVIADLGRLADQPVVAAQTTVGLLEKSQRTVSRSPCP